ncbi:hypothetical protein NMY22_g16635 [Coprinellus aureogranulatus]|nr:hypothetical protein NMY22_g16635 [Coprinellus aureogranulatus]
MQESNQAERWMGLKPSYRLSALELLPNELLTSVFVELGLRNLVSVRRVCRRLYIIAGSDAVCRRLFVKTLGYILPRPFFLSKPLKSTSAEGIGVALKKWKEGWQPTSPVGCFTRQVVYSATPTRSIVLDTSVLLPGGRWIVAGYTDVSVWYFDLGNKQTSTSEIQRRLLIPSQILDPEKSETKAQVKLAIDLSSDSAQGTSSNDHTLRQFNNVVMTCHERRQWVSVPIHIDVWRIQVCAGAEEDSVKPGEHLSSFTEEGDANLISLSLYGPTVACCVVMTVARCTVIVDWAEANGKGPQDDTLCWYIPMKWARSIHLIPGDRIVTTDNSMNVSVYSWRRDCPSSTLRPSVQDLPRVRPAGNKVLKTGRWYDAISTPIVIQASVQLVVPTGDYMTRIIILLDSIDGSSIQAIPIIESPKQRIIMYLPPRQYGHR